LLLREQYGPRPLLPRSSPWSYQLGMYGRYFADQFTLSAKLGAAIPIAIGLWGAVCHAVRERRTFQMLALAFVMTSLALVVYLNFTAHEVPERDYFFVTSFQVFAMWIGMGLAFALDALARRFHALSRYALGACGAAIVLFSLLPLKH